MANRCSCNWGMALFSVVLFAIALYFFVWGFASQTTSNAGWSSFDLNALILYLIGFLVLAFGQMAKWSSSSNCKIHRK